jgi:serine phosphatase RsbU (regulator of sigma subunit)/HAMP domain-containing protein
MAGIRQIPFVWKVILIVVLVIAISGIAVTGVAAYQFRRELYAREFSAAYTVYMAAVNYLIAHYKAHRGQFEKRNIDYVLERRFLQLREEQGARVTYRPSTLTVYNERGILAYEYSANKVYDAPRYLPARERPDIYRERYDRSTKTIRIAGPLSPSGEVPGYVFITLPSQIEAKTAALFRGIFFAIGLVLVAAIGLCLALTSRAIAPVQRLIRAAKKIRGGDLAQRVPVTTQDELGLLAQTFNDMVASLSRRLDLMHRLQAWTMQLSRVMDIRALFDMFLEMCGELAPAEAFRLYLYDAKEDRLTVAVQAEKRTTPAEDRTLLATRAFHENAPRFISRKGEETTHPKDVAEIALPLMVGEETLGVLWVGRPLGQESHDDETITILQTMAQHAASAIENVRLYAERAEKQRYEREMALARDIQLGMLPRVVPEIPGYEVFAICRPAFEVGGDYYDYIAIPEHGWCIVAGDVSGKGVPAAMIVSIVRTLLHTCVQFESSIGQVLRWINRHITPDLRNDMFVTLNAVDLGGDNGRVTLYRAGHEPAVLVRPSGEVRSIAPDGTALGLLDLEVFERLLSPETVHMGPGDILLLYTDGVSEALNENGEEFGMARLLEVARRYAGRRAQDLVLALAAEAQAFAGRRPQNDDITLLAIRRHAP